MFIRKVEKIVALVFWIFGLTQIVLKWNRYRKKIPFVMYHSIQSKPNLGNKIPMVWQTGMAVEPKTFEEQIREFTRYYKCVSVNEYLAAIKENKGDEQNILVITFDDGYIDNYEIAVPILKQYGAKATFFLVGSHLKKEMSSPIALYNMICDTLLPLEASEFVKEYKREDYVAGGLETLKLSESSYSRNIGMSWQALFVSYQQAIEMHALGFEIGAHGYYHLNACALDAVSFREDLLRSKRAMTDINVDTQYGFAYPFGIYNEKNKLCLKSIQECGFLYAVSTFEGLNSRTTDRFALRRIAMDEVPLYITMFRLTGLRSIFKTLFQRCQLKL